MNWWQTLPSINCDPSLLIQWMAKEEEGDRTQNFVLNAVNEASQHRNYIKIQRSKKLPQTTNWRAQDASKIQIKGASLQSHSIFEPDLIKISRPSHSLQKGPRNPRTFSFRAFEATCLH